MVDELTVTVQGAKGPVTSRLVQVVKDGLERANYFVIDATDGCEISVADRRRARQEARSAGKELVFLEQDDDNQSF